MALTKQEIFDKVWEHFVVKKNPRGLRGDGACAYLGKDGNKCAVGLFIPDGHPAQTFNGTVTPLLQNHPDLRSVVNGHDELLWSLQWWHDQEGAKESTLRVVAEKYSLTIPSEVPA